MAGTNFTEEDFPKGKNVDEQHNEPREDNKILAKELDYARRDGEAGDKFAKDFAAKVDDANAKLAAEIENTVKESDVKKTQTEARKAAKSADEAAATADEKAAGATGVKDEDEKSEDEAPVEKKAPAKKPAAKKAAPKADDDKPSA